MGTSVLFFEYPAYGRYVDPVTRGAVYWGNPQVSTLFPPYPMNVAKPEPDLPMPQMLEYLSWFDPAPEPINPNHPIPAAPPPSPEVIEFSSDESSRAWIDQMMAETY
ncbi:hypothetical protein PIB30_007238 [Stylosanthes scabra]|uniref:Uncharacterized protein n=1 Tax=Stylosanthes scabra TaxID=79078 RepID=A0ABU6V6D4_9FABA|nr:hypothetical protein [Stylosanthes scabra]